MKTTKSDLTAERLRELLHYAPETGVFTWRVATSAKSHVGQVAGHVGGPKGRIYIGVLGQDYTASRLAWLYTYGEWPPKYVEYINGNLNDNRITNLKLVGRANRSSPLSAARLRNLLHYSPETGVFTWKVPTSLRTQVGQVAGSVNASDGYRNICVDYQTHAAHRLAWLYMTGTWPRVFIDHINQVRDDNRFVNLREATNSENLQNRGKQRNNTSGHKGICRPKGESRWMAYIRPGGKMINLGRFHDINDAIAARKAAESKYYPFAQRKPRMLDKLAHHHLERLKTATTGRVSRSELARWVCENTSLNGKPYNFKTHWYQEELLNDPSTDICVVKPAQIGVSELSLRWALALVMTTPDVMRIGYTFPTYTAATNFARTRFANIIESCPSARAAMNTDDIDTVDLKTFGENREIHFRGAAVGNAAISTTLDMLVHDELSFSAPEIVATYTSRTQASKYKWRIVFSTPTWPGDAITTEMANSRRKMLMCKCNHCNHTFLPNYWRDVKIPGYNKDLSEITKDNLHKIRWQEANLLCPSCGRVPNLEREHRSWVIENPTENHVTSGYKLSPFDVPAIVTPATLIKGYTSYGNKTLFQQFALGEPAQDADQGFTEEDIEGMGVQLVQSPFTHHFLGLDLGIYCHIMIGGMDYEGRLGVVHMERVHLTKIRERIAALTAEYRVVLHLSDLQPYSDLVMSLTDEYPNLYAGSFVTKQGLDVFEVRVKDENPEKAQLNVRQVYINRGAVLDKLLSEGRSGHIWIKKTQEWDIVKAHMQDLKRATATLRNGEFTSTWQKSAKGNDHYMFALAYLWIAAQMRGMISFGMAVMPGIHKMKMKALTG